MDQSSLIHGTVVSVFLVVLFGLVAFYLVRRKVPRRAIFTIVEISVGIFAVCALISYEVADRLVLNGGDSLLIYIPPAISVIIFVLWSSRRERRHDNKAA